MRPTRKEAARFWLKRAAELQLEVWADRNEWQLWGRAHGPMPPWKFIAATATLKSDIIAVLTAPDTEDDTA